VFKNRDAIGIANRDQVSDGERVLVLANDRLERRDTPRHVTSQGRRDRALGMENKWKGDGDRQSEIDHGDDPGGAEAPHAIQQRTFQNRTVTLHEGC
jgi:hypothetical protein